MRISVEKSRLSNLLYMAAAATPTAKAIKHYLKALENENIIKRPDPVKTPPNICGYISTNDD